MPIFEAIFDRVRKEAEEEKVKEGELAYWLGCPVCGGAGADTENRYCLRCHGSGVIPVKEPAAAKGA